MFSKDGTSVKDAVVILKSPKLEGDKLTFDVSVLEGDLANAKGADGAAALFIDRFAVHYGGGGYGHGTAVVGRGPAWHGAWYAHPAQPSPRAQQSARRSERQPRRRTTMERLAAITPIRPATRRG